MGHQLPEEAAPVEFDAARYIARVRRIADLSQRELAETSGLSRSRLGRFETGETSPGIDLFVRILAVAGLRFAVLDADGAEVAPIPDDVLRDNGWRRFPAHLDVDPPDQMPPERRFFPRYDRPEAQGWYRLRARRDARRVAEGRPTDHPTQTSEWDRQVQKVKAADQRRERVQASTLPECECFAECFEFLCVAECPCQCEADHDLPVTSLLDLQRKRGT